MVLIRGTATISHTFALQRHQDIRSRSVLVAVRAHRGIESLGPTAKPGTDKRQ
jgi:hypothetical protein